MPRPASVRPRRRWWTLAAAPLLLVACGSGSGPAGSSASGGANLQRAGTRVESAMHRYLSRAAGCKTATSPVVCLEAADRTLGGEVHDYANVLALGHHLGGTARDLSAARDRAQTLANSLEILGDARPTQSNYDQVLNNFDVASAIAQLQRAVRRLDGTAG